MEALKPVAVAERVRYRRYRPISVEASHVMTHYRMVTRHNRRAVHRSLYNDQILQITHGE